MARAPDFITFTGADNETNINKMENLGADYPIEWAILFSPKRQGVDPRYPSAEAIARLETSDLRLAAHLCGDYAHNIMSGTPSLTHIYLERYSRAQINHRAPDSDMIQSALRFSNARGIAQARGETFPEDNRVEWLHDQSGGRGNLPNCYPPHPNDNVLVGYAGGIGPHNVAEVIERIDCAGRYWIDMEMHVRTDNKFDLELCRKVCEIVYGKI